MKLRAATAIALLVVGMGCTAAAPQGHAGLDDCAVGDPLTPQAEMFATSNTTMIADPNDPRLHDRLEPFASQVYGTIRANAALPVGSDVMDGVFWSEDLQQLTFEPSREFHLACVDEGELTRIAEVVAGQFGQESVLTFTLPARRKHRRRTASSPRFPVSMCVAFATPWRQIRTRKAASVAVRSVRTAPWCWWPHKPTPSWRSGWWRYRAATSTCPTCGTARCRSSPDRRAARRLGYIVGRSEGNTVAAMPRTVALTKANVSK